MEGFDDPGIFFSDTFGGDEGGQPDRDDMLKRKNTFKEFLRQFHEGNFNYKYR